MGNKIIDLTNKKFGRWLVVKEAGRSRFNTVLWECQCDCGTVKVVNGESLRNQTSKSCGCLQKEKVSMARTTHGMSATPTYHIWQSMISRCENLNCIGYKNWGGRGIVVCDRWHKFENFLKDMGEKPERGFSIERIDNDGNYESYNCKWATRVEQRANQRDLSTQKWFIGFNFETGEWDEDNNQHEFAKRWGLDYRRISLCLKEKRKKHY